MAISSKTFQKLFGMHLLKVEGAKFSYSGVADSQYGVEIDGVSFGYQIKHTASLQVKVMVTVGTYLAHEEEVTSKNRKALAAFLSGIKEAAFDENIARRDENIFLGISKLSSLLAQEVGK